MRGVLSSIICIFMVTSLAAQAANGTDKLVTVCDILGDAAKYNGKTVALLGRADCSRNLTDTSCFLVEDQCLHPLVTHGHRWPAKIWVQGVSSDEAPPQLSKEKLVIDESAMIEKLALLRRSTMLGFHQQMVFSLEDKTPQWAILKDEWGVAYGMVVFRPKLKPGDNCSGDEGCGGWNETPVMLLVRLELDNLKTFPDDKYPLQHKQ
jgi:hypothetical protein